MAAPVLSRREFAATVAGGVSVMALAGGMAHMADAKQLWKKDSGFMTGLVIDRRFEDHVLDPGHPESPERVRVIASYLTDTRLTEVTVPLTEEIPPREHILRVHSPRHYESVMSCGVTGTVAEFAVARILGAVKAVSEGRVRNAFCAIRPPGHHSHNNGAHHDGYCQGQGFCFFSNVVIAMRYAQQVLGHSRALIIDWDYHYGDGTNFFVRSDPTVLFYSTHNYYAYPGTGDPLYTGEGAAVGHTINVHLGPRATDNDIIDAWDRVFASRMQQLGFQPDFVFISAGFDSRTDDTLGTFAISDAAFATLTSKAMAIADQYCNGRLVSVLEGGYNTDGLGRAVCAHVATLAGRDWRDFVPGNSRSPQRRKRPGNREPQIRGGILHLPEKDAGQVTHVEVFDPSGRLVYSVPQQELGKEMIDLWKPEISDGGFVVELTLTNGKKMRLPMEEPRKDK